MDTETEILTEPKRLPRYRRAPREGEFALTARDLEILAITASYRLATSAQLQALADGSNQGILRRLQKLFHAGFLDRLAPQRVDGGGSAKMIYAITNRGMRAIQKAGLTMEMTQTDWNAQNRDIGSYAIEHTLLISYIRTVLANAGQAQPSHKLLFWREGRYTQDRVEVPTKDGYVHLPVAPDAYFCLEDAKGRMYFFLEADRATMTLKRFHQKLKAYAAYFREKGHQRKFNIRFFRVLTVTTSAKRQANLVSLVAEDENLRSLARLFLFTADEKLSLQTPESVLQKIWTMPGSPDVHSILGSSGNRK
jgi:hypothetical protein